MTGRETLPPKRDARLFYAKEPAKQKVALGTQTRILRVYCKLSCAETNHGEAIAGFEYSGSNTELMRRVRCFLFFEHLSQRQMSLQGFPARLGDV